MNKLQQITVRFKPEDMERIKQLAEKDNRPPANFIVHAVLLYIKQHEGEQV